MKYGRRRIARSLTLDCRKWETKKKADTSRKRYNRITVRDTSDESDDDQVEFLKRVGWCARNYKKSELRSNLKIVLEKSDETKG